MHLCRFLFFLRLLINSCLCFDRHGLKRYDEGSLVLGLKVGEKLAIVGLFELDEVCAVGALPEKVFAGCFFGEAYWN